MFYHYEGIWLLLPALLLTFYAQFKVKSAFAKYSKIRPMRQMTGRQAAEIILRANGIRDVALSHVGGSMTDHYDPSSNLIRLSDTVDNVASVAAIGVAAHEAGHAVQYAEGYAPIKLRMAILPVCQIGSQLSMPLFVLGLIMSFDALVTFGILLFSATVLFQLITLPVEFNASRRAVKALAATGILTEEELKGTRTVLNAAALTYVAAMLTAMLNLLRLMMIAGRRRD
ncbi:MAG: zinc metallopeptidase [Clostridia bacterium]|nr:zinc metallopeptidase [Clostridia bacterium]